MLRSAISTFLLVASSSMEEYLCAFLENKYLAGDLDRFEYFSHIELDGCTPDSICLEYMGTREDYEPGYQSYMVEASFDELYEFILQYESEK